MKPIAIIGIGNYLMSDEGVGIHAIKYLEKLKWPDDVELIDAGTPGLSLLHIIEGRSLVIILDCADFGGKPGDVGCWNLNQLKETDESAIDLHAIDILTIIKLLKNLGGNTPEMLLLGIQPEKIEMGTVLSEIVHNSLGKLRSKLLDHIK